MRTAQVTAWQPPTGLYPTRRGRNHSQTLNPSNLSYPYCFKKINLSLRNTPSSSSSSSSTRFLKSRRSSSIVCLSNSNSGADSEGSPWKAFEKALGNVTRGGGSIEDVLKRQMEKKEFYPERGGGGAPPRGNGGDGGGGGSDGSDGTEDGGFWDEALQVFLATIGLLTLYIYLIKGDELIRLAKDYREYVNKGVESDRLKKIRRTWRKIEECLTTTVVEEDPFWLEREIINTPTQYDSPQKYQWIVDSFRNSISPGSASEESKPKEKSRVDSFLVDDDDDDNGDDDV